MRLKVAVFGFLDPRDVSIHMNGDYEIHVYSPERFPDGIKALNPDVVVSDDPGILRAAKKMGYYVLGNYMRMAGE